MSTPAIIILILVAINFGIVLVKHGEPRDDYSSAPDEVYTSIEEAEAAADEIMADLRKARQSFGLLRLV